MVKKLAVLGIIAVMCLATITMTACVDYGYSFHFSVVGGNGEITTEDTFAKTLCNDELYLSCGLDCPESSQFIRCLGGKSGQKLTFIAVPNEGYQVKEWTQNGVKVDGNQTDSFTAIITSKDGYDAVITVEFEPISNSNQN